MVSPCCVLGSGSDDSDRGPKHMALGEFEQLTFIRARVYLFLGPVLLIHMLKESVRPLYTIPTPRAFLGILMLLLFVTNHVRSSRKVYGTIKTIPVTLDIAVSSLLESPGRAHCTR